MKKNCQAASLPQGINYAGKAGIDVDCFTPAVEKIAARQIVIFITVIR